MTFRHPRLVVLFLALGCLAGPAFAAEKSAASDPQIVVDADGITGTPAQALAISDDGKWLAAAAEKVVRIWNLHDNVLTFTLRGFQEPYGYRVGYVNVLRFSPDSRFLAIGVTDNTEAGSTRIYDLSNEAKFQSLLKGHLGCTRGIAFSPNGRFIATWGCDGQIIVSEWHAQQASSTILGRAEWDDQNVRLPELTLGGCFGFLDDNTLVFSHCGSTRVVSLSGHGSSSSHHLRVLPEADWPVAVKYLPELMKSLRPPMDGFWNIASTATDVNLQAVNDIDGVWFAGGGTTLSPTGTGKFWSAAWNRNGQTVAVHEHNFDMVAATFNGRAGLGASSDRFGEIHVWGLTDRGAKSVRLKPNTKKIWRVAWDNDAVLFSDQLDSSGRYKYNRRGPISKRLDLLRMAITPDTQTVPDDSFSPTATLKDGRTASFVVHTNWYTSRRELYLKVADQEFNLTNPGEQFQRTDVRLRQLPVSMDADATPEPWSFEFLKYQDATGGALHCLIGFDNGELWECSIVESSAGRYALKVERKFLAHSNAITSISVSPDRAMLATSSLDGTIRIWRLIPPRTLGDLDCLTDGTRIVRTAASDLPLDAVIQRFDQYTYFGRIKPIYTGQFRPYDSVEVQLLTLQEKRRRLAVLFDQNARAPSQPPAPRRVKLQPAPDLAEPLLSVFLSADGEWVVWNHQGFYNSSSRGARFVGFHTNRERHLPADFFRVNQFRGSFYDPNLILETLRTRGHFSAPEPEFAVASLDPIPPRINEPSGPPGPAVPTSPGKQPVPDRNSIGSQSSRPAAQYSISDCLPPNVRILAPADDAVLPNGTCHAEVEVRTQSGRPIKEILLRVNQALGPQPREMRRETSNGFDVLTYGADLTLEQGRYTLVATASHDRAEADSPRIRVQSRAPKQLADAEQPRLFVLAIGVSDYQTETLNLQYASEDAREFADAMESQSGRHFGKVLVKKIVNKQATRDRILDELNWLAENCIRRQDLAIVFVSGHGFVDEGDRWYFAPTDVDTAKLLRTGVPRSDFDRFLERIPHVLMCVDTCRKPTAVLPHNVKAVGVRRTNPFRGACEVVFFACAPGCVSIELDGHGVFTRAIIDALTSKENARGNRLLKFGDFRAAVTENVRKLTDGNQMPIVEMRENFDEFVIASVGPP